MGPEQNILTRKKTRNTIKTNTIRNTEFVTTCCLWMVNKHQWVCIVYYVYFFSLAITSQKHFLTSLEKNSLRSGIFINKKHYVPNASLKPQNRAVNFFLFPDHKDERDQIPFYRSKVTVTLQNHEMCFIWEPQSVFASHTIKYVNTVKTSLDRNTVQNIINI